MPQRRRPSAAGLMLLLLVALFGFTGLTGVSAAAPAASDGTIRADASRPLAASRTQDGPAVHAAPGAVAHDGDGGSCRPHDVPLKGTEAVVPHAPTDPLTASATARTPLPRTPAPRARAPRAPPVPVAGCAELLPVLRI
ncbi:hypothetical protein [Streptomyces sp. I05A-00742]|uniref:hypothetical protein n=1 Tax=Streptomyces sp. I05A-00742 TaxID=2732853 RepID=UPI001488334B|nr:hypothetical protein [Streptomyces sp. I05A-00742]